MAKECRSKKSSQLNLMKSSHSFVGGTLNEDLEAEILIDTGATWYSFISDVKAKELIHNTQIENRWRVP